MMSNEKHLPSALTNKEIVSEKGKLLLINENKSNNFDVKSNKQIEEMAKIICPCIYNHNDCESCGLYDEGCLPFNIAKELDNRGYRKQSEIVRCEDCQNSEVCPDTLLWCNELERLTPPKGFCHCGAKMKGGEE